MENLVKLVLTENNGVIDKFLKHVRKAKWPKRDKDLIDVHLPNCWHGWSSDWSSSSDSDDDIPLSQLTRKIEAAKKKEKSAANKPDSVYLRMNTRVIRIYPHHLNTRVRRIYPHMHQLCCKRRSTNDLNDGELGDDESEDDLDDINPVTPPVRKKQKCH